MLLIIQSLEKETNKYFVCRSTYFSHQVFTEVVLNASVTSVHGGSCKTAASFKQSETLNAHISKHEWRNLHVAGICALHFPLVIPFRAGAAGQWRLRVCVCVYVGGAVGWCYSSEIVHNLAKPS